MPCDASRNGRTRRGSRRVLISMGIGGPQRHRILATLNAAPPPRTQYPLPGTEYSPLPSMPSYRYRVTLLDLLPRPARAGVVASDVRPVHRPTGTRCHRLDVV